jgi:(p)ppGpp synthase/HD superfamily hydrolase
MNGSDDYLPDLPGTVLKRRMLEIIQREHAHQARNGGRVPYWMHTQSVAEIIEYAFEKTGELAPDPVLALDLYLAAQGHDLYEDTSVPPESIRATFGERVNGLIVAMTNETGDHDRAAYVQRMALATEEVRLIKLADLADNLASSAYGVHDLGVQWIVDFLMPIADEMRRALHVSSFHRYRLTAALLLNLVEYNWVRLEQNCRKFQCS